MVYVGPLAPVLCPNGQACPHDIDQHRYEPDRERWVCTVADCWENPYRVIKLYEPFSGSMLSAESAAHHWRQLREAHPEATFEVVEYPHIGIEESRRTRRRRLGLMWWQRDSAHGRDERYEQPGNSWRGGPTE